MEEKSSVQDVNLQDINLQGVNMEKPMHIRDDSHFMIGMMERNTSANILTRSDLYEKAQLNYEDEEDKNDKNDKNDNNLQCNNYQDDTLVPVPVPVKKLESLRSNSIFKWTKDGVISVRPYEGHHLTHQSSSKHHKSKISVFSQSENGPINSVVKPSFTELDDYRETVNGRLERRKSTNYSVPNLQKYASSLIITYVDIETGDEFSTTDRFLDRKRFRVKNKAGIIMNLNADLERGEMVTTLDGDDIDFKHFLGYNEVDSLGLLWRWFVTQIMLASYDQVNALRITRTLQFSLFFQTGYEAYLIDQVIAALNSLSKKRLRCVLHQAMKNRNVSRIIVRTIRTTWDYFWHTDVMFKYGKYLDSFQQIFFFTGFGFPASENFVNTRDFTVSVLFRLIFGEGNFFTRSFTGRQALQTDNENVVAQNLAAETTGFETANRNQYGTYLGRLKTNAFRRQHRLPVDESLVRSFQAAPLPTTTNNGVEHVLRQLARHWANMLYQPDGNFAHQRMEQLNPYQFLRFQLPPLLVTMATLRGICSWDAQVLSPFVSRLQYIRSSDDMVTYTKNVIKELKDDIIVGICGGIASRVDAMTLLVNTMEQAVDIMTEEAKQIDDLCKAHHVDAILSVARKVLNSVNWKLPSDNILRQAVHDVCIDKLPKIVNRIAIKRALNLLAPKDKRMLIELLMQGYQNTRPARLLLDRTVTLLQRELRRDALDAKLIEMSKGKEVKSCNEKTAYWLIDNSKDSHNDNDYNDSSNNQPSVYIYDGYDKITGIHRFHHRATRNKRFIESLDKVKILSYVEVAEEITVTQWVFMKIELDYGKRFTYSGFMEYDFLRERLRFLIVVSQWQSYVLDDARLNRLQSFQQGSLTDINVTKLKPGVTYYTYINKQYEPFKFTKEYSDDDPQFDDVKRRKILTLPPQSMIVIGGGPTGLLTTIHCLQNVLISDGEMKLYESRDAFTQGGATFERSQIVRLDARWIAMLRYHMGTIYEDVFVPAAGETDSHYGNSLPFQGFIEITIKDLENMMNIQVAKLASRGLLHHYTNSNAQYDYRKNQLVKLGKALHLNDLVLRKIDPNGNPSKEEYTWRVAEFIQAETVNAADLVLGQEYVIYVPSLRRAVSFRLIIANLLTGEYCFQPLDPKESDLNVTHRNLPYIYPKGAKIHSRCDSVVLECVLRGHDNAHVRQILKYSDIENDSFIIDIEHTHVVTAIGKPHDSPFHIEFTTEEPYGVCCLSGLKVSMNMHNFGTRRWKIGIIDDIRSNTDQNTRVVGDFTKIVNTRLIAINMVKHLKNDPNWKLHFTKIINDLGFDTDFDFWTLLVSLVKVYRNSAPYKRSHVQTRFFETGDNFYLGMEFTREYDKWKTVAVDTLTTILMGRSGIDKQKEKKQTSSLKGTLAHHIDRLWYDATLETIRLGDVYNPGGRSKVPRLYMIDSLIETSLHTLDIGESFRLVEDPTKRYEIVMKNTYNIIVRDFEGRVSKMMNSTKVKLGGNLTRAPDGLTESKVAIATFPVGHYLNYRSMRMNNSVKGYVFAFLGDEQSSPHFMRYSGLTGAAINAMLFDNFVASAIEQVPFQERFKTYAASTNWSNGEVVQRGTTNNYGEDGFLRPGFSYQDCVKYLQAKVQEHISSGQDMMNILSRDWKIKFAAALIPRGMEFNDHYLLAMIMKMEDAIFDNLVSEVEVDYNINADGIVSESLKLSKTMISRATTRINEAVSFDSRCNYWKQLIGRLKASTEVKKYLISNQIFIARHIELVILQVIEQAQALKEVNGRVSTQAENQPPSTDAFIDDFAVEAQPTTNILVQASTYAAISLSVNFISNAAAALFSAIFFWFSLGTISNTSRYKNRNEEWRVKYYDDKFLDLLKGVYACLNKEDRKMIPIQDNPFYRSIEKKRMIFENDVKYYDYMKPEEFIKSFNTFVENIHDPNTISTFMEEVVTKYLADIYHVNSYLQEDLVNIYAATDEMLRVESTENEVLPQVSMEAMKLFKRILLFESRLKSSLQRGTILFGAFKVRALKHNLLPTLYLYIQTIVWLTFGNWCSSSTSYVIKPVAAETWDIIEKLTELQTSLPSQRFTELRREIIDLVSLYYATMESYTSSYVIFSGWLSFCTGSVFFIGNVGVQVTPGAAWAEGFAEAGSVAFGSVTPITSIMAAWYLFRQLRLLLFCDSALRKRYAVAMNEISKGHLGNCLSIMRITWFITLFRLFASLAAAAALPFALTHSLGAYPSGMPAFVLAVIAVGVQVVSNACLFVVEYDTVYKLTPKIGEYIGVAFEDEMLELKRELTIPNNDILSDQLQDRMAWEYVARAFLHRYRFDTAFGANRFGSIMQYIQSGLQYRPEKDRSTLSKMEDDENSYNIFKNPYEYITLSRFSIDNWGLSSHHSGQNSSESTTQPPDN